MVFTVSFLLIFFAIQIQAIGIEGCGNAYSRLANVFLYNEAGTVSNIHQFAFPNFSLC